MNERRSGSCDSEEEITREDVRSFYSNAAVSVKESLCCPADYKDEQLSHIPKEVLEISYGCGSPMDRARIQAGETVVDLGSGGGTDCFIAAKMVGKKGKVFGIDMTEEMLGIARKNADKVFKNLGYHNVEFKHGFLEAIPLEDASVDLVTSNCVVNLSTNNDGVFKEICRILKPRGRFIIADIISDQPVPNDMKQNRELWGECISGALTLEQFLNISQKCDFIGVTIRKDYFWKSINSINFYSFILEGHKLDLPGESSCKTLSAVYSGPFTSVTCGGSVFKTGVPVEVDETVANILRSEPFRVHFNIMGPEENATENSNSSCCG